MVTVMKIPPLRFYLPACWVLAACAPKMLPRPDAAMEARALRSGATTDELHRGHTLYLVHCQRCHEAVLPADLSRADWHLVLPGMSWNAGIDPAEEKALSVFIAAATR